MSYLTSLKVISCKRDPWYALSLIAVGHFLQKSPIISGTFAKRDLQRKASYAYPPSCSWRTFEIQYVWNGLLRICTGFCQIPGGLPAKRFLLRDDRAIDLYGLLRFGADTRHQQDAQLEFWQVCVFIYLYIYIYICIYIYIYIYIHMYIYIRIHICVCISVYIYIHICVYIYIHMYTIYTYMCVYIYIFICMRAFLVWIWYGVATIRRLLKMIGLFCKKAL